MLRELSLKMMSGMGKKVKQNLDTITKDPMATQTAFIMDIIEKNKDTEFGIKHNFRDIHSIEDYQRMMPLTTYDDYVPYIEELCEGKQGVTTTNQIVHFNKTSGTMGTPKKIPLAEENIKLFSKYYGMYYTYLPTETFGTSSFKGKAITLSEGSFERLPCGITYGSASSLSSDRMQKFGPMKNMMDILYTSPVEARQPVKGLNTRYLHAVFALAEENVTYANATFASYILEILKYIETNWEMLVSDIETGTINESADMPDEVRASVSKKLKPNKKRAALLRSVFSRGFDTPFVPKIWPGLKYIICVGGAGFLTYTERMKERYLGPDIRFMFLGLSASEGLFSIPTSLDSFDAVFVPDSAFMEFLPLDEEDPSKCKTLGELEVGGKYEIIITNLCGLYRYRMRDAIEVTGFYNNTPTMQFLYRVDTTVSVTGEKTTETALRNTVTETCKELKLDFTDYTMYPDTDTSPARYIFLLEFAKDNPGVPLETIRDTIEKHLAVMNPSMGDKVKTGICSPTKVEILQPETCLLYRDLMIMKGASAAQLKPVHVIKNEFQRKFFFKMTTEQ